MRGLAIAKNADQVEHEAVLRGYASTSDGLADEEISGELDDEISNEELFLQPEFESETWAIKDEYLEVEESSTLQELKNRSAILGELYPFEIRNSSLKYLGDNSESSIYETLLMISLLVEKNSLLFQRDIADNFERLSCMIAEHFFGCSTLWWTGAASENSFKDLIDQIHIDTQELEWSPTAIVFPTLREIKDGGIDLIAHRDIIDSRTGKIFVFGQSACGQDWIEKTKKDLDDAKLRHIFKLPFISPIKFLCMPYLHALDERIICLGTMNLEGAIFDRARITHLYNSHKDDATDRIVGQMHVAAKSIL